MQLKCLTCVIEHKMADQTIGADNTAPEIRDAITFANTQLGPVTPICYEHLEVHRQSSLVAANGSLPPLPPRA